MHFHVCAERHIHEVGQLKRLVINHFDGDRLAYDSSQSLDGLDYSFGQKVGAVGRGAPEGKSKCSCYWIVGHESDVDY